MGGKSTELQHETLTPQASWRWLSWNGSWVATTWWPMPWSANTMPPATEPLVILLWIILKGHWSHLTSWSQWNYWISLTSIVFLNTIDRVEMRDDGDGKWDSWWLLDDPKLIRCLWVVSVTSIRTLALSRIWVINESLPWYCIIISLETLWSQRNCYNKHILCSQLQKVLQPQLRWSTKMSFSLWCARLATRWKHLKTKRERCRLPLEVQTCCNLMCICHLYHLYMLYAAGVEAIWQHIFFLA